MNNKEFLDDVENIRKKAQEEARNILAENLVENVKKLLLLTDSDKQNIALDAIKHVIKLNDLEQQDTSINNNIVISSDQASRIMSSSKLTD